MMPGNNGPLSVPPGFRFHPTDEELLYYYLRKKIAYEAIDLDVIRDVDLNKLEPWDLKDKCRIGSGPQNEWYFFSHKDKKYPTGTRTNRATVAGFWKATGRDKAIHLSNNSRRIGMRKTLVFYIGRAPNGQKTDWIMHEYRLDDDNSSDIQEDGWVVCRAFKKKNVNQRGYHPDPLMEENEQQQPLHLMKPGGRTPSSSSPLDQTGQTLFHMPWGNYSLDCNSMHLPQLLSTESSSSATVTAANFTPFMPPAAAAGPLTMTDVECSQNLMKLTTGVGGGSGGVVVQHERFSGDWSILDKLLASHQNLDQLFQGRSGHHHQQPQVIDTGGSAQQQRLPLQYLGCEADLLKFPK